MTVKKVFQAKYPRCQVKRSGARKLEYKLGNESYKLTFKLGTANKSSVIFSVDCIFEKENKLDIKHCDEFVFCDINKATGIYFIEDKGGDPNNLEEKKVYAQIKKGADLVEENFADGEQFEFMPILVIKKKYRPPSSFSKTRKKYFIKIRGKEKAIVILKEGDILPPL